MKSIAKGMSVCLALAVFCFANATALTFRVNVTYDQHDANPGDGNCGDSSGVPGACAFRAAVEEANAHPGPDTIIVSVGSLPILLSLGTVAVTGNSTTIIGVNGGAKIDGLGNPFGSTMIEIRSDSNQVKGLVVQRSRGHGIAIYGADNFIGGWDTTSRNRFVGNCVDRADAYGLYISGTKASNNQVIGNFVGMRDNGAQAQGNANGIGIDNGAYDNIIGGLSLRASNLISGNTGYGLVISGEAHDNVLFGNLIGPDPSMSTGPGNRLGGLLITRRATNNNVGSTADSSGNLISANYGAGVIISGTGTISNYMCGNFIGPDFSGRLYLGNHGPGVLITDGAQANMVGGCSAPSGNEISGNDGDGVRITGVGTNYNIVANNYIGVDIRGYSDLSNGQVDGQGVYIGGGARYNVIGGDPSQRNSISGNFNDGVLITGLGTSFNQIRSNFIGVTALGNSILSNGSGVVIRDGASDNEIGGLNGDGNVISGNQDAEFPLGAGVMIYDAGTERNVVIGNLIGTDVSGTTAIRNGTAGVVIGAGAQYNLVGGPTANERNIISGNGTGARGAPVGRGVYIFGVGTRFNRVIGNYIGTSISGSTPLANVGNGIAVTAGAEYNEIGGIDSTLGNRIAYNNGFGVFVGDSATHANTIRNNSIYRNDSLGIVIRDGAQGGIRPPTLVSAIPGLVTGSGGPRLGLVDIYLASPTKSGIGDGKEPLGTTMAGADGSFSMNIPTLASGDTITANGTDAERNSSSFSANIVVSEALGVDHPHEQLPVEFSLSQNYPNPCNPSTEISFSLPHAGETELVIYDVLGRQVSRLVDGYRSSGHYTVMWTGSDDRGRPVASGVYLYVLRSGGLTASRKLLLLK